MGCAARTKRPIELTLTVGHPLVVFRDRNLRDSIPHGCWHAEEKKLTVEFRWNGAYWNRKRLVFTRTSVDEEWQTFYGGRSIRLCAP